MKMVMKKFIFAAAIVLATSTAAIADSVISSSGDVITGKIISVSDDLIQIRNNFIEISVTRSQTMMKVEDIVDVKAWVFGRKTQKVKGRIYFADQDSVKMKISEGENITIPRFRIRNITMYNPAN